MIDSYLPFFYNINYQQVEECNDIKLYLDKIANRSEDDEDYSIFVYVAQKCRKLFFEYYRKLRDENRFNKKPSVLIPFGVFYREQIEGYEIDVYLYIIYMKRLYF